MFTCTRGTCWGSRGSSHKTCRRRRFWPHTHTARHPPHTECLYLRSPRGGGTAGSRGASSGSAASTAPCSPGPSKQPSNHTSTLNQRLYLNLKSSLNRTETFTRYLPYLGSLLPQPHHLHPASFLRIQRK